MVSQKSRVREDAMLRFLRICGFSLAVHFCASPGWAQQQQLTPEQRAEAAAQYQRAMQQQQAMAAQGKEVPTLVMTAETAIAAGAAQAQGQAQAQAQAAIAQAPFAPLNQQQTEYLDKVLQIWEQSTGKITRYECKVTRWQYDTTVDAQHPANVDTGVLKYAKPDKGLYRIDKRESIAKKGPNPEYRVSQKFADDYWICDGEYLHIRDRNEKQELKKQLPPDQRGNGIHNSPLPFLFGVKAAEIKQRYWIRPLPPQAGSSDVWLEAWPKLLDDAGSYSRVQVILDAKEVLPKGLIVFLPNWTAQAPNRDVLEFSDRKNHGMLDAIKNGIFMQEFIDLDPPSDWKVIVEPYTDPQEAGQPGQGSPNSTPRVAQPPAAQPPLR